MAPIAVAERVQKLNRASQARIVDPDKDLPGRLGEGAVLPADLLLPAAGLDEGALDDEQFVTFSRAALASITTARLLDQLGAPPPNPMDNWFVDTVGTVVVNQVIHHPALLYTMVLAGEEIPDLMQKRAADHPGTDPFVREVNRYHRQEEARHLAFARMMLPEVWERASLLDKTYVRFLAPTIIREMYENMIHAGVFGAVGLPALPTWRAARNHPGRVEVRVAATRPVLDALVDAGAIERGKVPTAWRGLCAVDPDGHPTPE